MLVEARVATSEEAPSFDGFVAARSAALWRSAWLLTGDSHRAEDLVQTALARTYPHFARVGADGFEGYVRTTMYRTYLSWWRRRWTAELPGDADPGASTAPDLEVRHDVRRALAALPRQQRAVVVLVYFDDLTGPQAAELLGVSVGTVKSTLSRALAKLRTSPLLTDGRQ
ncbi:MAG: SigE family RNA polymerase sigma factor [Micropruina sp.]|uniref:SigE family RNA polymerase sigma factor n=1 Tax=Micropruina sp. TaxID=2737536 RepID=UPI0039E5CE8F